MVDYAESSQLNQWLFRSPTEVEICRSKANLKAREFLTERTDADSSSNDPLPVEHFACGFSKRIRKGTEEQTDYSSKEPFQSPNKGYEYLTPHEEATLVSFYASRLPSLIGPEAQIDRLRRESKVTATAALLYRRFFLSNSVMLFDPKAVMVAAAFLASKVEDATADIRYLEDGTKKMNAAVHQAEIIPAEVALLQGTDFDLLCFHPYKAVVALTEDLRTFLRSKHGRGLVIAASTTATAAASPNNDQQQQQQQQQAVLSGRDLKPLYDKARQVLDQVIVSDLPLLYSPGQIGMAALMWAQDELVKNFNGNDASSPTRPTIDWMGYLQLRFPEQNKVTSAEAMMTLLSKLKTMLSELPQGKHGCLNDSPEAANEQLLQLKAIHKKFKKVRVWGQKLAGKKKKRANSTPGAAAEEPPAKKAKSEAPEA